jgi:hypothetical protein
MNNCTANKRQLNRPLRLAISAISCPTRARQEGADAVSEATALACLCIASKFAEDAPNALACTTRLSPRCSARALRQAELDTFRRLDMTVDFQDSFFVMTELMILCLNWRLFHPDQIYALAERVSSLVYAGLMPHLLGHRRDTIAAAVVLVALRLVPVDEALLDVTARRLLLHCCCERSGDDTVHHAGSSAAFQRAEPAVKHAPAASEKAGPTSMLSRDIRALTLATQASACSSPPSQTDEVAGQHREYYRVAGEIAALERIIWEVVGAELNGEVSAPMHPQPTTPMHAQSSNPVFEWQCGGGGQGETDGMAREKYFAA